MGVVAATHPLKKRKKKKKKKKKWTWVVVWICLVEMKRVVITKEVCSTTTDWNILYYSFVLFMQSKLTDQFAHMALSSLLKSRVAVFSNALEITKTDLPYCWQVLQVLEVFSHSLSIHKLMHF